MSAILLLSACVGLDPVPQREKQPEEGDTTSVGSLSLDATEIDFGPVDVGDEATRALALTNTGEGPLHVEATLRDEGVFTVDQTALDLEGTVTLTLGFQPDDATSYAGALALSLDNGDSLELPLLGEGVGEGAGDDTGDTDTPGPGEGALSLTPARHDFGTLDLGDSDVATFVVENTGDADVLVTDASVDDRAFTVAGDLTPPQVLSPGDRVELEVTFAPTAASTYGADLVVTSDAGDATSSLTGEGVDRCDICSPIIDVDTGGDPYSMTDFFSFNGSTDSKTVTVQNVGDLDLEVSNVLVNNDAIATCGEFAIGGWSGAITLAPWDSTAFTIEYTADGSCLDVPYPSFDANVVHILSDDPGTSDWVIEVGGAGL
ncbi:MAG: choice-of-anchor D domain-containing protein [Myxococcota bacterium]